ncbi:ComEC/Rec2 family competence protein [uncultured Treponema sp.]|uniref:ComEC/Rec2 family competence protein n=1 Tax=uncultured Treponema sp. TaxID=162155 RepID=UPI0025989EF4|nr:ComEC/Rec2 family competence protein [uncultured Treponema sp.]
MVKNEKILKSLLYFFLANPVFLAALVCAFLFYFDIVSIKDRECFNCLFPSEKIVLLKGNLASSPVKSSSEKKYYAADFKVSEAVLDNSSKTVCSGTVKILIPSELVEKYYPGKIYTSFNVSKNEKKYPLLFETGNNFLLNVDFSEGNFSFFVVKSAVSFGFSKSFSGFLQKIRSLCRLQFKRLMYGWNEAGGLLLALLSGSREYTESLTGEAFKNAGLSHILALSGMHLNLFGGIAFFFGKRLTKRSTADFFQLAAIIFFVWFAGLSPSLFRAMLSSLIVFFNSALRMRRFKGITVLSASFLLQLMIFPVHLKSPAFMLSYGALAGIMSIGQVIKFFMGKRFFPKLASALSESAGAQIFTAPVTLSLFGKIMPVGIISSVIVSPFVIIFLYAGLFGTLLSLSIPFLGGGFSVIMNVIYLILKKLVLFFAKAPIITI